MRSIQIGSGKAQHAPAAAEGPEARMTRCGAGLSRGVRGHSATTVTSYDVTCKNCLKLMAHDAVAEQMAADAMAEISDWADYHGITPKPHQFEGELTGGAPCHHCGQLPASAVHIAADPAAALHGDDLERQAIEESAEWLASQRTTDQPKCADVPPDGYQGLMAVDPHDFVENRVTGWCLVCRHRPGHPLHPAPKPVGGVIAGVRERLDGGLDVTLESGEEVRVRRTTSKPAADRRPEEAVATFLDGWAGQGPGIDKDLIHQVANRVTDHEPVSLTVTDLRRVLLELDRVRWECDRYQRELAKRDREISGTE